MQQVLVRVAMLKRIPLLRVKFPTGTYTGIKFTLGVPDTVVDDQAILLFKS
jgi:hypothetical protein